MSDAHFTLDELHACARGQDATLIGPVIEHCRTCRNCGDQLAALLALQRLSQRPLMAVRLAPAVTTAVAVTLAVVLAVLLYSTAGEPAPSTAARLRALATKDSLDQVIVKHQLGGEAPVGSDTKQERLQAAGALLVAHRYGEAITVLSDLHAQNPASLTTTGYLGIARYLSGDDSEEVGRLLATASLSQLQSAAQYSKWYLANYLLRTGRTAEAREVLLDLREAGSEPGHFAARLLGEIDRNLR